MLGLAGIGGHRQIAKIPQIGRVPKSIILYRDYPRRGPLFGPACGLLIGKLCASRTQKDPYR